MSYNDELQSNNDALRDILEDVTVLPNAGGAVTMFIAPDGNDNNDGLTVSTPKKTVRACVNAGASRISAKRGVYNDSVELWNIGELEIFPTDNNLEYAVGVEREPIVFETVDVVEVDSLTDYNSIKQVAYSNAANTQFDKVFVKKSLSPLASDYGSRYNSTIWLLSGDEKTVCLKLKPVLTVAECEAEANTFTYVDSYIYINADLTGVEKIVVPTNWGTGFYVNGAERLVLTEVEVRFSGTYNFDLRNCAYFELYKCSAKYTSYASGFHPFNSNGKMTACYATKNFDGYGISGYGHTTFVDCVSEFNFDDGMSHHDGCEGTVIGGRYEGNGKGGNTPAYGAKVNIYGGVYKNNRLYGIGYLSTSTLSPADGMVQGATMVDNPTGLNVDPRCNVIATNCVYVGNTADVSNRGNLTEYNSTYVKTVNGIEPDVNGNVVVAVSGGDTGLGYTNQLPIATDASGAIYNGVGYENGYRLNSSAVRKEAAGCGHTGFIPATAGSVLRFKNIAACQVGYGYITYWKADKATAAHAIYSIVADSFTVDENGVSSFAIPDNDNIAYVRLSYGEMSADSIITIDEEITE